MQVVLLRSSRGISSAVEVFSIIRHLEQKYKLQKELTLFKAPRNTASGRYLGYVLVECPKNIADEIVGTGAQYIRVPPQSAILKKRQSGPYQIRTEDDEQRKAATLYDVLVATTQTSLSKGIEATGQNSLDETSEKDSRGKLVEIVGELATGSSIHLDSIVKRQRSQKSASDSMASVLKDSLMLFNGFAQKGHLKSGL